MRLLSASPCSPFGQRYAASPASLAYTDWVTQIAKKWQYGAFKLRERVARAEAKQLLDGHDIELWQLERMVTRSDHSKK